MKKRIILLILIGFYESSLFSSVRRTTKPIGSSYHVYPELVAEAKESLHPIYNMEENFDYIMNPRDLLVWWRFDIIAKYIYALHRELEVKSDWAKELYLAHERVWSNCYEADGSKIDCATFLYKFDQTIDSIKKNGFDSQKGKIRLDISKYPCDGSHRIGSCILYNKEIICTYSSKKKHATYSSALFFKHYNKFIKSGLDELYLDNMAFEYCKLKDNTLMVVVQPGENIDLIKKTIRNAGAIVYEKKVLFKHLGYKNFLSLIPENLIEKNRKIGPPSLMVFLCEFNEPINQVKQELEKNIFKNNMLICTSNHLQTIEIAKMLFLNTSIKFLNKKRRAPINSLKVLLNTLEKIIIENDLDKNQLCIIGDSVMSAYGETECTNLHVVYHSKLAQKFEVDNVLIEKTQNYDDIIFNPKNHFYYKGIKFSYPHRKDSFH